MSDWRSYFTFQGRLNRKPYWLMNVIMFGVALVAFIVIGMLAGLLPLFWILGAPLFVAFVWAGLAIGARRLHDRNKSAWWLLPYQIVPAILGVPQTLLERGGGIPAANLLGLISFAISMWALADLGFMKGKPGPNRFGDDPLGPAVHEVFA